jgi:hypothetical protein
MLAYISIPLLVCRCAKPRMETNCTLLKSFLRGNKLELDLSGMMDNIYEVLTINSICNSKSFLFVPNAPFRDSSRPFYHATLNFLLVASAVNLSAWSFEKESSMKSRYNYIRGIKRL